MTDKSVKLIILLANFYVYKCKLQGSVPVLSVFQAVLRSRYNIESYASFMLRENFDFKMQWLSYKTLVELKERERERERERKRERERRKTQEREKKSEKKWTSTKKIVVFLHPDAHTHTHTHTRTCMQAYTHSHTHTCMHAYMHASTPTNTPTHTMLIERILYPVDICRVNM